MSNAKQLLLRLHEYTQNFYMCNAIQTRALTGIQADWAAFSVETYGVAAVNLRAYQLLALCNGGLVGKEGEMKQY